MTLALRRRPFLVPFLAVSLSTGLAVADSKWESYGPVRSLECQQSALWIVELTSVASPPAASAGTGPLVAILDGAVDLTHPGLASRVETGFDFVDGDFDPGLPPEVLTSPGRLQRPGNLHGTAMATLVATIAPNARLAIYRVLDEHCAGTSDNLASAIRAAVADGAGAILLSLEIDRRSPEVARAMRDALDHDVVLVAAAGNSGRKSSTAPAHGRGLIAVAAVDEAGQVADFSAYGPRVEIYEIGVHVPTDVASGLRGAVSGTSVAAARVAGAVAVLREQAPWLDRAGITAALTGTATPLPGDQRAHGGIVNLEAALSAITDPDED